MRLTRIVVRGLLLAYSRECWNNVAERAVARVCEVRGLAGSGLLRVYVRQLTGRRAYMHN